VEKRHRGFLKIRRPLNAAVLFAALVLSATCGDSPASPKSGPVRASFAVAPSFAPLPAGAPTIPLSKVQASLTGQHGEAISHEAAFSSGVATLTFDVTITGSSATFELDYAAFDLQGVVVYRGHQTITVRAGLNASLPSPTLVYDAPDAKITTLRIAPNPINVAAGATANLTATGTLPNGQSLTPRVAWTSSNAAVAAVSDAGVVTAGKSQGTATITATSANGLTATAPVKVQAPVDHITVNPPTLSVPRGNTATATADIRDATNAVIDDRAPVWTSSDQTVATVSNTGVVSGLKLGKTTITATLEGKSGSTAVTVVSPIDHIELSPGSLNFTSLKTSLQLTATVVPAAGGSATGLVPEFRSSNPSVATVDSKGLVTSVANGTASITADVDGVTASAGVTVQQAAAVVSIQPRVASVSALGAASTFTATVVDAANNPLVSPTVTWTSSDQTVAKVTGTGLVGTVTGLKTGNATITADVNGKTDAVSFIVAPAAQLLVIQTSAITLQIGKFATVRAFMADANRNPLFEVPARFSTTTPNIISVDGNVVVGRSSGVGRVVATYNNFTAELNITVQGGNGLTIQPDSVELLLGGAQRFRVAEATEGSQYTWTVNVNGKPTEDPAYGTVTQDGDGVSGGFYTAPTTMPAPSTFQVCASQVIPALTGCAKVVLVTRPTGSADVIVVNDMNLFDSNNSVDPVTHAVYPNNAAFFRNLVQFTGTRPRTTQTGVMMHRGHLSRCATAPTECAQADHDTLNAVLAAAGFNVTHINDLGASIGAIPSNIKVIFLWTPRTPYSNSEINILKSFAAEGGRIVFIGEWGDYYTAEGIATENSFLASMGAQMTNTGGRYDCGRVVLGSASLRPHQVTTGMSGITLACASQVIPGRNDYAFLYDSSNSIVLGAVAKIDLTALPPDPGTNFSRVPSRVRAVSAPADPAIRGSGVAAPVKKP